MFVKLEIRDVRILSFCTCRILRRIGQRAWNRLSCTELTKRHRNCKILHILYGNVALSSALTAAIAMASANHLGVKVMK